MDELIDYIEDYNVIQFFVSLDYNIDGYETEQEYYSCLGWAELYIELGEYNNNPLIINGDPDHHMWHMFSGTTYSAYAFIDHNMVIRYLLDSPNLDDFKNHYIPELLAPFGCLDQNACNYDINAEIEDQSCLYGNECGDINIDTSIDVYDIIIMIDMISLDTFNYISDFNLDNNIDIIDILSILNLILQ